MVHVNWTQTATIVAANGDEMFATAVGTGTLLPNNTSEATLVSTFTGGTGRFSGTLTTSISSVTVSMVGTTITSNDTEIHTGQISY